jgi:glycosyltransferase involved in cell wall biosynthesis
VHFVIVGKNPHTRLDVLRGRPGVTITGFVPDIRPYIQAADVYVAPLRMGSGTRFKLLEAMAMRRAVVSTRMGAEGLQVKDGHHLLLADAPADFARAVIELLKDDARRAELGANAAGVIRKYYDWEAIIPQVEAAYASVAD